MFQFFNDHRIDIHLFTQKSPTRFGIKHQVQAVCCLITDRGHQVSIHHVVDQRNMFVANSLDIVFAVAVVQHGWTFERFDRNDLCSKIILEPVSCSQRAC